MRNAVSDEKLLRKIEFEMKNNQKCLAINLFENCIDFRDRFIRFRYLLISKLHAQALHSR
jgi:hypothetical protein